MGTLARAVKGLPFSGGGAYGGWGNWMGAFGTRYPIFRGQPGERDWGKIIGDGSGNSIVEACVLWICRNFPEARMVVMEDQDDDVPQEVRRHPLPRLWKRPNPFFSGVTLWYAFLTSFIVNGNSYIIKLRNESGRVTELWYVPHFMMTPRWLVEDHYIDYYEYMVNGQKYAVDVEDVYHIRYGLDPYNIRLGRSPLRTLFRELGVDEEASRFSASVLYNLGVPGVVITPDKEAKGELSEPGAEAIKAKFKQTFGGDNRGDPIVLSKYANVTQFGFSPQELDLSDIRDVPEERVTAVLGIPPAVVGFQQKNSKVGATRSEERDQAYENCIIPAQVITAAEMTIQMLPDFAKSQREIENQEVAFDLSKVRVLLDAQNKLAERHALTARAGLTMRKEGRSALGYKTTPDDEVYIPSPGVQEIKPDGTIIMAAGTMKPPRTSVNGPEAQLALPAGKEFLDALERKELRRDQLMLEGFKELSRTMMEVVKEKNSTNGNGGFKIVRDESGRLSGIERGGKQDA